MDTLRAAIRRFDWFIDRSGKLLGWLVLAFVLSMAYEVIARYVFNSPTVWSYDISYMLGGGMTLLGGAYLILHDGHVRVDVIYGRLSPRRKLVLDIVLWLIFFLPMVLILVQSSYHYAYRAWVFDEVSGIGIWRPPMFPYKAAVLVAWVLVLLEGIAWFIKNVLKLLAGEDA